MPKTTPAPDKEAQLDCDVCGRNWNEVVAKKCFDVLCPYKAELPEPEKEPWGAVSDGSTASYYELPMNVSELQHLISYKNMNAQIGEIFRAAYRYGQSSHSDQLRDAKKILFYAQAEVERLEKYE